MAALSLWTDWLDSGYAPNSVINNTQTTTWQEFATGEYAFGENGTWQLANSKELGFEVGIIAIPARDGGTAPAPTGGEFVTIPVQDNADRYGTSADLVACLTSADNSYTTVTTLSYVAPTTVVQDKQAVHAAKGRTSDNLGTRYPQISEPMWTAVQAALSGSDTASGALSQAQSTAAAATE